MNESESWVTKIFFRLEKSLSLLKFQEKQTINQQQMKKTILMLALMFSAIAINAQTFNDIPLSGGYETALANFQKKGYKITKRYDGNSAMLTGTLLGSSVEIFVFATPKTKQVYKYVVYLRKHTQWSTLYEEYRRMVASLINKYGEYNEEVESFLSPYEEGDGYEMQAVELDKCKYMKGWIGLFKNDILIAITEYKQVKIAYQNNANMDLNLAEISQINTKIF